MRAILIALTTTMLLAGCETVKGVGRDVTNTAEAVDRAF